MDETQPASEPESGLQKFWHVLRVAVTVVVIGLALWLLYHQLKHVGFAAILKGARQVPVWRILLAMALTVLNYAILVGYDWAAIRYVQHPLKLGRIAFASFICYAMSHNFGWIIGGPASRYRMYSAAGLTTLEIVKLVAILAVAYWTGFFALSGLVFVVWPPDLPTHLTIDQEVYNLPAVSARPLGIVFIVGVCSYLAATAFWKTPLKLRGHEFSLPPFRLSSFMVTTAMLDIAVASSVLFAVLPPDVLVNGSPVSLPMAMSVYLMAMVVVITLHIPGGVGVFEAVVLAILRPDDPEQLATLAGVLLVYRGVYYLLPLTTALLALIGHEIWMLQPEAGSTKASGK